MGRTHLRALAGSSVVRIAAVAESHEGTANELRGSGQPVYPNLSAMLEGADIDGILIAASTDQHLALVDMVARAGLPILCEKPCGLKAAEAREAASITSRHGVPLQVAYWRRFIPSLRDLRLRIAKGEMGTIHFTLCSQWDEAPPGTHFRARSGGIFVDMGVHEIDQIRWLAGQEVTHVDVSVFPTVEDPEVVGDVDSAQALLTLADGSAAFVSLGRFHPGGDLVSAEVYGSRGHVRLDVLQPADGEGPQLDALRRQAEAFSRWALGGDCEGATIDDAISALVVAHHLSEEAGLGFLGQR